MAAPTSVLAQAISSFEQQGERYQPDYVPAARFGGAKEGYFFGHGQDGVG
jgi:hypothetical protein